MPLSQLFTHFQGKGITMHQVVLSSVPQSILVCPGSQHFLPWLMRQQGSAEVDQTSISHPHSLPLLLSSETLVKHMSDSVSCQPGDYWRPVKQRMPESKESTCGSSQRATRRKCIHFQPVGSALTVREATAVGVERCWGGNNFPAPSCCGRRN